MSSEREKPHYLTNFLFQEMHDQMSGYKRMRREHQAALLKLEEKCKVEMEQHKTSLDKEYDLLLHSFTRELEKLSVSYCLILELFKTEYWVPILVWFGYS